MGIFSKMNKYDLVVKAIEVAITSHGNQRDRVDNPYVLHPLRVMNKFWENPELMCVAVLHDVIEDTQLTSKDLLRDFPKNIVDAVVLLTKEEGQDYDEYIARLLESKNKLALEVKLADMEDNSSFLRVLGGELDTSERAGRKLVKYRKAVNEIRKVLNAL